jgi:glutaredoxin 2
MAQKTVNYLLAMEKSLRERLNQLNELKTQSARRTFYDADKREEPTYDIKKVDQKITAINKALFEINHKIKESNAKTTVEVELSYDDLVSELE